MTVFYNENDPKAAAWLRELIRLGHIAEGVVDERSIEDIAPVELAAFTQCHFFAGIGGWSLALRRAGWPDGRPVWTGSCPCQPFSAAGKGKGFADERHLWPAFFHLISQCQPDTVFGEQVAGRDGAIWLDLVCDDLEGLGYAVGTCVAPAAGFGAPHIRHRTYWLADASSQRRQGRRSGGTLKEPGTQQRPERLCDAGGMDDAGRHRRRKGGIDNPEHVGIVSAPTGAVRGLGHTNGAGFEPRHSEGQANGHWGAALSNGGDRRPSPTNGLWCAADWIGCTDGKWRPVEPGTFPLAHGVSARVVRLRGYGNAIVPQQAAEVVKAGMEFIDA